MEGKGDWKDEGNHKLGVQKGEDTRDVAKRRAHARLGRRIGGGDLQPMKRSITNETLDIPPEKEM